jgi:hypothetical protein
MKKLFLLFLSFFLVTSNSFAKYTFSFCYKKGDAPSCSGTCEIEKGWVMDYKINTENKTIIQSHYIDNKLVETKVLESCKIVDKKNWQCVNDVTMTNDTWYVDNSAGGLCGKYSIFK